MDKAYRLHLLVVSSVIGINLAKGVLTDNIPLHNFGLQGINPFVVGLVTINSIREWHGRCTGWFERAAAMHNQVRL